MARILNLNAFEELQEFIVAPYKLSELGADRVLHANHDLGQGYVIEHDYYRPEALFRHIISELKDYSPRTYYKTSIDVCCGTGYLSERLQTERLAGKSYAIDMNSAALRYLRGRIAARPEMNIIPLRQDVCKISIEEGTADLIIGNSFLHHLPDNSAFLNQCHDLLSDNGILYLVDEPSTSAEWLESPLGFLKRIFRRRDANQTSLSDVWLYSASGLRDLVERAGFTDIRIKGFGLFTTIANFFIYNFASRILRIQTLPRGYYSVMYQLMLIESRLLFFLPADWFGGLMLFSRKSGNRK